MYAINRLSDISCFNVIDSLSIVLASLIMALRYGFYLLLLQPLLFGCLSVVLLKIIIGSQVDLKRLKVSLQRCYHSFIIGRYEVALYILPRLFV
jgi:hypothetical protein